MDRFGSSGVCVCLCATLALRVSMRPKLSLSFCLSSESPGELAANGYPADHMRNLERESFGRGSVQERVKGDASPKTITINTHDHVSSTGTAKLRDSHIPARRSYFSDTSSH